MQELVSEMLGFYRSIVGLTPAKRSLWSPFSPHIL